MYAYILICIYYAKHVMYLMYYNNVETLGFRLGEIYWQNR